jgi:multidrug efflux pump subunit AcrA (membrane-fusion protein)
VQISTQVVAATTGTMQQTVTTTGTIDPAQQANLNFAVSGQVSGVDVTVGQNVTAGQTLATVDPSALAADLAAAQASLTAAQAKLANDQANGAATSQVDSDEASVTTTQSQVAGAQTNLSDANLTSTIAGVVASVGLSVGQQVTGGSSSSGSGSSAASSSAGSSRSNAAAGTGSSGGASSGSSGSTSAQVVVIAIDSWVVSGTVDDTQVGQVKVGDQSVITPTGSTTKVYGTVASVGLIASQSSNVAAFPVQIAVTGSPGGLYAGATANVSIVVRQINNAIQVPTAAISYPGGQPTVSVVGNGKQSSRAVTTGVSVAGQTQITSGLRAGEKIVERVVRFNGVAGGGGRSLFGGTGSSGGFPGGGFPGGGFPGGGGSRGGRTFTGGGAGG